MLTPRLNRFLSDIKLSRSYLFVRKLLIPSIRIFKFLIRFYLAACFIRLVFIALYKLSSSSSASVLRFLISLRNLLLDCYSAKVYKNKSIFYFRNSASEVLVFIVSANCPRSCTSKCLLSVGSDFRCIIKL